jgi:transposase, IS6 family
MFLLASSVCGLFKWRQFEPEVILLAVSWYLRFSLSYRDVEELLAERRLSVDHVTVWRWVQRYAPEMERRLRSRLNSNNDSWRVDETYIRVKGKWRYLYRAVDSSGATLDFLLSAKQDAAAAKRFLAKALGRRTIPRLAPQSGSKAFASDSEFLKGERPEPKKRSKNYQNLFAKTLKKNDGKPSAKDLDWKTCIKST